MYIISPFEFQVIKNPITDHLPVGCRKIGTYSLFLLMIGGNHSLSTYAKFSEKLTYACVSGAKKCYFFEKFCVRPE